MRSAAELDNLMDASFNFRNEVDGRDGHIHNDVVGGFYYFDTIFKIGNRYFQGTINIKNVEKGKLFKDITKIKDVTKDISSSYGNNPKSTFLRTSFINSIPNNSENSKTKFSLPNEYDVIAYANEHETEFVDVPPVRDYEKKQRAVRQQTYGELLAQVEKLRRDKYLTKGRVIDESSVREETEQLIKQTAQDFLDITRYGKVFKSGVNCV